jgi:hypothetical protein
VRLLGSNYRTRPSRPQAINQHQVQKLIPLRVERHPDSQFRSALSGLVTYVALGVPAGMVGIPWALLRYDNTPYSPTEAGSNDKKTTGCPNDWREAKPCAVPTVLASQNLSYQAFTCRATDCSVPTGPGSLRHNRGLDLPKKPSLRLMG